MIHIYLSHYEECPTNIKCATEHQLGLKLLSHGLSEIYHIQISPDALSDFIEKNDYGKPYLKDYTDIHFNISHCDGIVACGFSDDVLGVDIEMLNDFMPSILRKVLTLEEQEVMAGVKDNPELYKEYFCRYWTLKESRIKQAGLGFHMEVKDFSFEFDTSVDPPVITCSEPDLHFYQQMVDDKYVLAVCSGKNIEDIKLIYI